ncbi:hypothetical protein ACFS2C_23230 [Prauserella oleivorans]|uniref:Tetratricopeptide repeat protein n=1 Tax=Prauserella oleivorans TaxID=1478153 RepID=A0ABW5WET2_9PSEU
MSEVESKPDAVLSAIGEAVTAGRSGSVETARRRLVALWHEIGVAGDPLHRCTLAHHLADLYDDPARALAWDVRALDAADALIDDRVERHHTNLGVAGFYPSLHLNLADDYRRLGSFEAAGEHIAAARRYGPELGDDGYGRLVRAAIEEVAQAITQRVTDKRASAP